jgi:hypothetical protein
MSMSGFDALDRLAKVATEVLPVMIDPAQGLACHKRIEVAGGYANRGVNALYTAMTLVGLAAERGADGLASLPDAAQTVQALRRAAAVTGDHMLMSATIWALALCGEDAAGEVEALRAVPVRRCSSMGLGLALTATAALARTSTNTAPYARVVAAPALAELERRYSPSAQLFRASAASLTRGYVFYRGVTSFASQVYPLQGMAEHFRVFGGQPPEWLGAVAAKLVDVQGPLGQWWWLYSDRDGRVLDGYPVYSVHQDAMAFMALLPLQRLGIGSYQLPLSRGLTWMGGDNELERPLVDREVFIYRAIQRCGSDPDAMWGIGRAARRAVAASQRLARPAGPYAERSSLELLRECRPYHLGWILLARSLAASTYVPT